MFYLLSLLWLVRETKMILFWLYLWQLKEYHIGRFIDHFQTEKGKSLIFNPLIFLKIFLAFTFFSFTYILFPILIIIYLLESVRVFQNLIQKKIKFPVLTKKSLFLIGTALFFEIFFLFSTSSFVFSQFLFYLLIFDILTPAIVSGIVLIFQPITFLIKNQTIGKAKKKREQFKNLLVIGIAGSYGKTSTKEFLATILSERYRVLKTKEHQNSEIGISQCILNDLKPEHEIFVVEMGAYNRGGIKLLCDIAKPKIGILTGINEQHMVTFGSQENIIAAKYELIESLPEDGLAIFNGSDPHVLNLYLKTKKRKRTSMLKEIADGIKPDLFVKDIKVSKDSITFRGVTEDKETEDFKIKLLGGQNIHNLADAILTAKELGMSFKEIKKACLRIKPEQGGMRMVKTKEGFDIIDSTYSANPDGVISHLDYLKTWSGKKVIVTPCLIELGSASKEIHRKIGEIIGKVCNLAIITTKDRFKEIKEGATKSGMLEENILFIDDPKEIFEKIRTFCRPDDVVLLEGRISKEVIDLLTK